MKTKTVVSLVLALVMGVAAFLVGRDLLSKRQPSPEKNLKTVNVVAAQRDIEVGQKLDTGTDLKLLEVPESLAGISGYRETAQLDKRVAAVAITKGQVITESMLAKEGLGEGLQCQIDPGMRAVTVEVTESTGMSGLLVPGCIVDVVSTLRKDNQQVARTIVQKAIVKAIGPRMNPVKGTSGEVSEPVRAVTLQTDPKSVEKIDLAVTLGHARLTLRRTDDTADLKDDKPITLAQLAGIPDEPVAPKYPLAMTALNGHNHTQTKATTPPAQPPVWNVEVYRRGVQSTVPVEINKIEPAPNK